MHTRVHAASVPHLYLPESLFLQQKQWVAGALPPAAAETFPQLKCTWPAKPLGDKLKVLDTEETRNQLPKTQIPVKLFPPHPNPRQGHSTLGGSFYPPKIICGVLSASS